MLGQPPFALTFGGPPPRFEVLFAPGASRACGARGRSRPALERSEWRRNYGDPRRTRRIVPNMGATARPARSCPLPIAPGVKRRLGDTRTIELESLRNFWKRAGKRRCAPRPRRAVTRTWRRRTGGPGPDLRQSCLALSAVPCPMTQLLAWSSNRTSPWRPPPTSRQQPPAVLTSVRRTSSPRRRGGAWRSSYDPFGGAAAIRKVWRGVAQTPKTGELAAAHNPTKSLACDPQQWRARCPTKNTQFFSGGSPWTRMEFAPVQGKTWNQPNRVSSLSK